MPEFDCPSRRTLLRVAALAGVSVLPGVLSACAPAPTPTLQSGRLPSADVPSGTVVVVAAGSHRILVAQPSAGQFAAYSATCPHQGALVRGSDTLVVRCPAHGSEFDTADGGVPLHGPATTPLQPIEVSVDGDELVFGPVPERPVPRPSGS